MNIRVIILGTALLSLAVIGCGESRTEFHSSEKTGELFSAAAVEVQSAVRGGFGEPNEIVVWQKFGPTEEGTPPAIDFGGWHGTVVAPASNEESSGRQFIATFNEDVPKLEGDFTLVWLTGP
ncbi:MAG: hypothetical protein ACREIV_05210, partial [Planctomycetaceae bacterium]